MQPVRAHAAVAAILALALCGHAAAQGQGLRLHRTPPSQPPPPGEDIPAFVVADRIRGIAGVEVDAIGNAELRKGATTLFADRIRYVNEFDEAEALGDVRLRMGEDELRGPRLRLRVSDNAGVIDDLTFTLAPRTLGATGRAAAPTGSRGTAKVARFDGQNHVRASETTFTTCKPGQDDWEIAAEELDLDLGREVGTARGAQLTFLGLTTPKLPDFDFPLNNRRKSGLLPPSGGISNARGWEVIAPYYLNLAPNYDATIAPRYMQRRGFQILSQFRYLLPTSVGEARLEYLPRDKQLGTSRWGASLQDSSRFGGNWTTNINYTRVSDNNYFRELSGRLATATQVYLPEEASITYGAGWWNSTLRVQQFQTLQDPDNPVPLPYKRMPQLTASALRTVGRGFDLGASAEAVSFERQAGVTGKRGIVYPYVARPFVKPYGYITPKVGVSATYYSLSNLPAGADTNPTRVLPIASLDSGLFFDRDAQWFDQEFIHTLEPRVYYLWVPYRNQNDIPIFDTSVPDFNAAQLFSENYYVGGDRISNANQVTVAATSRLIRPDTGQEAVRLFVGQRFYFEDQKVRLDPQTPLRTARTSPILASIGGQIAPHWRGETSVQYSWSDVQLERFSIGARFSPEFAKVLNAAYRYARETSTQPQIKQVDVSAQWPLGRGIYALARVNYDFYADEFVEALGGIEYNAGCWIVRGVVQSFVTSSTQRTYEFFVQLELNGLARIGTSPLDALRRSIPGYTRTNAPASRSDADAFESGESDTSPFGHYH
ncbi:MAG: LPS-assembly protein LptD [Betaproteobacteria bacterium]|nr:LPS-assembly protein LptD [Betaproteobacteria bacterium]